MASSSRADDGVPSVRGIPGPYRSFFYSFDCSEPMHVHVRRDSYHAKFWLIPIELVANHGFSPRELSVIRGLIQQYDLLIIEAWNEHCDDD